LWHVTAIKVSRTSEADDWFAHRQYSPTDSARE
jgi:hypothetical protein